jgi:para-nitrobenzyl esterase
VDGVVLTSGGMIRGVEENGVWVFKGVPYARADGGAARWRPPEPVAPWHGIRDAVVWGPIAPQTPPRPGFSIPTDPTTVAEDCLNLNVWTPRVDDGARPVMVWVHGGGFTTGTGSSLLFRGDRLSSRGDVVVVTLNYRLGALGFLAHPVLSAGAGCGNWGLLDQLAALGWVAENIANFGGDPTNVTVFGESAGAMSISALLGTEAAAGLFHRAVIQSGPPTTASLSFATRRAERLAALMGVGGLERNVLEQLPADVLVAGAQRLALETPEDGLPLTFMPVIDGGVLERLPGETVGDGRAASVPILIGTTRDEAALFTIEDLADAELDETKVARRLAEYVGGDVSKLVVDAYVRARRDRGESISGRDLWTAIVTDYVFRVPSTSLASTQSRYQPSTFVYLFAWESPFMGGVFGSSHGLEIPFVFGTVQEEVIQVFSGSGPDAMALSEQMQQAWLAFARRGDPTCDAAGEWPAYDPARRATMVFGPNGGVRDDPRGEERVAWEHAGAEPNGGHHHE